MKNAPLGLGWSFSQLESGHFLGWTQIIAWSRCFGGVGCVFFPGIAVIHLTPHEWHFCSYRGSQRSTHHFSRRKTSPEFPRAVGSGEGHCRSCSKGGGGVVFPMEGRSSTPRSWNCSGDFYVLRLWTIIIIIITLGNMFEGNLFKHLEQISENLSFPSKNAFPRSWLRFSLILRQTHTRWILGASARIMIIIFFIRKSL